MPQEKFPDLCKFDAADAYSEARLMSELYARIALECGKSLLEDLWGSLLSPTVTPGKLQTKRAILDMALIFES